MVQGLRLAVTQTYVENLLVFIHTHTHHMF
jgi:hypothetical protein